MEYKTNSAVHPILTLSRRFLSIVLLLSMAFPLHVAAANSRFQSDRTLVFGVNNDFAPYEFINANNEVEGYTIDLIRAIARSENLTIKFLARPWHRVQKKLLAHEIDGVTAMLYSKERDIQFDFSLPYVIVSYAIFKRKATPVTSINDLKNKEVIVVEGVYAHEWLKANRAASAIVPVDGPRKALELLESGQYDFAVLPRLHGIDLLEDLGIDTLETTGPPILEQKLCFAVTAGNSDLLAELNEGLFALQRSNQYDKIYSKWFSVRNHQKQTQQIIGIAASVFGIAILIFLSVVLCNWLLKRKVKEKTRALQQKETRLNQIVEAVPIPTYVIDEKRKVAHWNNACAALTGIPAEEMVGTGDYGSALFGEKNESIVDLLLNNALSDRVHIFNGIKYRRSSILEGAYKAERYMTTTGSGDRWIAGTATVLKDESGTISGAIETWQDLTEHKQLEKQLIQSQKMEAIGVLAGGIAHDFNNLLSGIIGYSELELINAPERSSLERGLNQILAAGLRAKKLVNQILTFSRQTEGEQKPVQINAIVTESIELIGASLPSNIEIRKEIQSDAFILADATHIHQVVMNLLSNAVQAMSQTGGDLSIQVDEIQANEVQIKPDTNLVTGRFVRLVINDTGHGIPPEIQNKIFDPFFTTKKRGQGTGMGLSVVHGIVKQHDGFITFNSVPGKSTTFEVFFPFFLADATSDSLRSKDLPLGSERILIIDSDEMQLEITENVLSRLGYKVVAKTNIQGAHKVFVSATDRFDLVIIDKMLPGFNGEQFAANLAELQTDTPVIFLSSYNAGFHESEATVSGKKGMIVKPIVYKELAELIRDMLK